MTNLPLRWNAYYNVGRRILLYTEYKAKKNCLPNNVKEMQYIIHGSAQEYMHAPHTYIHILGVYGLRHKPEISHIIRHGVAML